MNQKVKSLQKLSKGTIALIILTFLSISIPAQTDQQKFEKLFAETLNAINAKDHDLVIAKSTELIIMVPELAQPYFIRGTSYVSQNNYKSALSDFTNAIDLGMDDTKMKGLAFKLRGLSNNKLDRIDEALSDYNEAIKLSQDDISIYKLRAEVLRKLGKNDLAEKDDLKYKELSETDIVETKKLSSEQIIDLLAQGKDHFDKSDWESALKVYDLLVEGVDENFEAIYVLHFSRGRVYYEMGEFDAAIKDYNKSIELEPNLSSNFTFRGEAYLKKKDLEKARKDFDKAVSLDQTDILAFRRRAEVFYLQQKYDQAIADATNVIKLDPKYNTGWYFRGVSYFEKGDNKKALRDLTEYLKLEPMDAQVYLIRSRIYQDLGQNELAFADEEMAKRIEREDIQ